MTENKKEMPVSPVDDSKLSSVSGGYRRYRKENEDIYCPNGEFCPHCRCMQPTTLIKYGPKTVRCDICGTVFVCEKKGNETTDSPILIEE